MDFKKFIIALVAGFVVMFLLSGLWHVLIMGDFYKANTPSAMEQHQLQFIALGYLILAVLMSYIYPKGYQGGTPVTEGLKFGIVIGLLWILPVSVVLSGVITGYSGKLLIVDSVWHIVEQGIGGIVIGLVYGSGAEETSAGTPEETSEETSQETSTGSPA